MFIIEGDRKVLKLKPAGLFILIGIVMFCVGMTSVSVSAKPLVKKTDKVLKVGDRAPDFTLMNESMKFVKLSDEIKKGPVVLNFYLFDFSGGCHNQLELQEAVDKTFGPKGVSSYGISVDSPFAHAAWKKYEDIKLPLLSDFNKDVSKSYGAYYEKVDEWKGLSKRAVFVIGKDGLIKYAYVSPNTRQLPDVKPVEDVLRKLTARKTPGK
jgi:peroxiredoxin